MNPLPPNTDGASGGISWFYRTILKRVPRWEEYCYYHDWAYAAGGSEADRKIADKSLRNRMIEAGYPYKAWLFYIAVRLFGWSHFKYKRS